MDIRKLIALGALTFAIGSGLAQAKIPVAPMDDAAKAKAEEAKAKKAAAAKHNAEMLAKAQDHAVENYKKGQAKSSMPAKKDAKTKPARK